MPVLLYICQYQMFQPNGEEGHLRLEHHRRGIIGMENTPVRPRLFTDVTPSERQYMREDSLERDTRALLVQLLHEQLGSQVELVDTTIANRREDYVVLLATLRHPTLSVVVKLAGPHAPSPYPFDRTALFHRLVATHTTIPIGGSTCS